MSKGLFFINFVCCWHRIQLTYLAYRQMLMSTKLLFLSMIVSFRQLLRRVEPYRDIMYLMMCAPNEDSDLMVHEQSDLSLRLAIHRYPTIQVFYIFTSRISLDIDGNRDDGTRDWVHMYKVTFSRIVSQLLTHTHIVFVTLYVTFVCGKSVIMELKYTSVTFCIHF